MYYLHEFCVICLKKGNELNNLFQKDDDGITYYQKLITSITEMGYKELNVHTTICFTCCQSIEKIYNFRRNCLKSKSILSNYISKLHVNEPARECNKLYVRLNDYKRDTKTKKLYVKLSRLDKCGDFFSKRNGESSNYNCELLYKGVEPKPVLSRVYFTNIRINNLDVLETCQDVVRYNDCDSRSSQDSNVAALDIVRVYFEGTDDCGVVKYENKVLKKCSVVLENIRVEDYVWESTYADVNLEDALWPEEESNKQQLELKFSCYICYKKYYKECGLYSHMISHFRRTPYVCSICHHRFPTNVHLHKHFNEHTINENATYFCHICKSNIPDLDLFTTHTQNHKEQPPPKEVPEEETPEKPHIEEKPIKPIYYESIATNSYYTAVLNGDEEGEVSEEEMEETGKICMWNKLESCMFRPYCMRTLC